MHNRDKIQSSSNPVALLISDLTKSYSNALVLDHITASFEHGKIHGLIGRNGSGKTVLLKCLCGLTRFDTGKIFYDGHRTFPFKQPPKGVGVIIETPGFSPHYSGYKNLLFLAKLQGSIGKAEVRHAMQTVGLDPSSRKRVGKYSLGMRQRLGIAQAFMEDQRILLRMSP